MTRLTAGIGLILALCSALDAQTPWHTNLELANGQLWQKRVVITIQNDSPQALAGETIEIKVGRGAGEIDLGEAPVPQIRACAADGVELLVRVVGPDRKPITRGPAPAGSTLVLPTQCEPKSTGTICLYFDNPDAWPVPDFLEGKLTRAQATVTVGSVETLPLKVLPKPQPIIGGPHWRLYAQVPNFDAAPVNALVMLDLSTLTAQCERDTKRWVELTDGRSSVPAMRVGDSLLFSSSLFARSQQWYCVWMFQQPATVERDPRSEYLRLMTGRQNRVKNADFEQAENALASWDGVDAQRVSSDAPGLFGKRCAKLEIAPGGNTARGWFGPRQDVAVNAGRRYFVAAWVKCKDVEGAKVALHIHWRTAKGAMTQKNAMGSVGSGLSGTTDWVLMSGMVEAPGDAAALQLHLTHNGSGTIWYDGATVAEVSIATPGPFQGKMGADETGLVIWPVHPVIKVFREDLPPARKAPSRTAELRISAARNEAEPLQLAIRGSKGVKQVKATIDAPVHASGAKLLDATIQVVGYVPIDHKTNYYHSPAKDWQRRIPGRGASSDGWPGWWPDPLLPRDTFDLEAQTTQPIWITVNVPKDAPAGDYRGKLKLTAEGKLLAEAPFVVYVHDFVLPDPGKFKAIYDVRLSSQWTAGTDKESATKKMLAFMAKRRVSSHRVLVEPAFKYENGKVVVDFSEYDKAAEEYFNTLHHPHTYAPAIFYSFGWAHPPRKFLGQEPYEGKYPYEGVDRGKFRPEYKQVYQACLKAYLDHMKEKGWYDKVLLYVSDEPHFWEGKSWGGPGSNKEIVPQMKAVCEMIHEVDPKLPIYSSTWWYVPAWDGFITAWGIGFHGIVAPEKITQLKQGGARVLWTTDGHMCTDTPYCGIERLLPHFCFKYGVEGYEFWGATWLTYDPYQFGWHRFIKQADKPGHDYYIRYPNGDGYLVYPGAPVGADGPVSSVRLEQARDGVEDYEYLVILRDRIAVAKSAGKDVAAAMAALDAAQKLVTIPNSGGRFSTKLLPDPQALANARDGVARAIDSLR